MTDREAEIQAFLAESDWCDAQIAPLAGDASNRRYLRLSGTAGPAVLMDAPADKGEDIRPFIHVAGYMRAIGLSAPCIYKADTTRGLMLLEDLGDDLFARVVSIRPDLETCLYSCAIDLLVALHRASLPEGLAPYCVPVMADMATLAFDWYLGGARAQDPQACAEFHTEMQAVLTRHAPEQTVLIQRDYHAENLLWLPGRSGTARVGLLDFQDAMLGHPAYDLVSLLQDARRDVSTQLETDMIARYIDATGVEAGAFTAAYHCLGAQRNLRILGVFSRLCLRDGKAHYIDLIPRVWRLLDRDLAHPALGDVARIVHRHLPAPDGEILESLKAKCAIIQPQ